MRIENPFTLANSGIEEAGTPAFAPNEHLAVSLEDIDIVSYGTERQPQYSLNLPQMDAR